MEDLDNASALALSEGDPFVGKQFHQVKRTDDAGQTPLLYDEYAVDVVLKFEIGEAAWDTCNQNGLLRKYWGNACYAYDMYGHSGRDSTEYEYVRDMLSSHGPILFHYTRDKGIHTIVLVGYDDEYENILIIDPWWDPGTAKAASTYSIGFSAVNKPGFPR